MSIIKKSYSELIALPSFEERFKYLMIGGAVGKETFGSSRYLNQMLYHSSMWKNVRRKVILRDDGCDLAHKDFPILGNVYIHHLNPITIDDIVKQRFCVVDPENLIVVSFDTHNAIHYGNEQLIKTTLVERTKNDTCPWKE